MIRPAVLTTAAHHPEPGGLPTRATVDKTDGLIGVNQEAIM